MFGMFGTAKIKAYCIGETLNPMKKYANVNINNLANIENFDLSDEAYTLLSQAVGVQKSYHAFEMICATWLALILVVHNSPQHTFAGKVDMLERGLRSYLSDEMNITRRTGMPRGLFVLLEKYL